MVGPAYEGISLRDLEKLLPARTQGVKALLEKGPITAETVKNPVTGRMQPVVKIEELERFQREYATLHNLSQERGEHFARIKKQLVAAGVKPAVDPDELGFMVYRRSDLL